MSWITSQAQTEPGGNRPKLAVVGRFVPRVRILSRLTSITATSIHDNAGFGLSFDSSDSQSRTTVGKDVTYSSNEKGNVGVDGSAAP